MIQNVLSLRMSIILRRKNDIIVLSDDDTNITHILSDCLKDDGFEHVYTANSSDRTIKLSKKIKPSLIITDFHKADMNGIQMALSIKMVPSLEKTKFILFSTYIDYEGKIDSDIFTEVISKPGHSLDELLNKISFALVGKYQE